MKTKKLNYAWIICLGCAILLFCTSGLSINAFSIYQPYILKLNNFTNAQTSTIILFRNLFIMISMFFADKYYEKFSLRVGMTLAGLQVVLSLIVFGLAKSYAVYCIAAGFMGIGYGLGTMIPVVILLKNWFVEKRNTAIGLSTAATGLSTLGIPTIINKSINANGLGFTFFAEAVFVAILITVCFLLIRDNPREKNTVPYGYDEKKAGTEDEIVVGQKENVGLQKKDWFFVFPILVLLGGVMNVSYSHLTVLMTGEGISTEIAAVAIAISGLALMFGKMLLGRLGDKLGNFKCNFFFGPVLLLGLLMCCFIKMGTAYLYLTMVIYTVGISFLSIGLSSWPADLSTASKYEKTVQRFQFGYSVGSLTFSSVPGIIADHSAGSYVPAYIMFLAMALIVVVSVQLMFVRIRKRSKREIIESYKK